MINVKDIVYEKVKKVCSNLSDTYPSNWAKLPAVQFIEEENNVFEFTEQEDKSYIRFRFDIWHNRSTSQCALDIDKVMSELGFERTSCGDVNDPSGLKHKLMRYEAVIDTDKQFIYHKD